ncbi:MAG TPA: outer membrane protein assembly factor BamD [Xanthomonadales bacterium]|nr:outer membrane protein assembly factor BamD [Xanthomonadales bacterium]
MPNNNSATKNSANFTGFSFRLLAIVLVSIAIAVGGCSSNKQLIDNRSAAELYADAKDSLDKSNWRKAVQEYRQLQVRYPFGRFTEQSMLDLAYAYYKSDQPEGALSTLDRFIRTYPAHPNIDYAFYLKGLVNYDQNLGFLERIMPERVRDRDQTTALDSFADFKELLRRFPDSRYAGDARQRMVFLRNNLAAYEVSVAEYYMRREAYIAVTNRARYVLENYPGTPDNADALMLLHQAYSELSMPELADDTWEVLQLNYPDHYYVLGEKKPRTWKERLWPFD